MPAGSSPPSSLLSRLPRQLAVWSVICGVSAAPSFVVALLAFGKPASIAAMLAGIATFAIVYALIASTDAAANARRDPRVRLTLRIGYGTRIALSLLSIVPFVAVIDMFCGMLSISITNLDEESGMQPFDVYLTTIVQGIILNTLLFFYMAAVHAILLAVRFEPPNPLICRHCGYDLRASPERCPECGTANTADPADKQQRATLDGHSN